MEKCQKFHLDYIEGIDKLPVDTYLVLFGTAKDANKEPVIASAKVNSFWKHFCPENIKLGKDFDLATAGTDKVTVQCQHNRKILTFGLPVGKIGQHSMRSLIHNEPVSIYGRILREGEAGRKIIPKIIIGGERNDVLMHLH